MKTLAQQLHEAWIESGLTLAALIEKSGLALDEPNLSRKLRGKQKMRTEEAEALAHALRVEITAGREARAS